MLSEIMNFPKHLLDIKLGQNLFIFHFILIKGNLFKFYKVELLY